MQGVLSLFLDNSARSGDAEPSCGSLAESNFQRLIAELHHAGTIFNVMRIRCRAVNPALFDYIVNPQLAEPPMLPAYRCRVHLHAHAVISA